MMMRNTFALRAAAAICTLLATACGSSSGPNTNLKSVFFRTVIAAPVATLNLKRADGTAMGTSRVRIDTRATFDGWVKVGRTVTVNSTTGGVATVLLPAGSYPIVVDPNIPQNTALVGTLNDTLAISADITGTWQTSKQAWTVTSPKAFSAIDVVIYQMDGGAALYGADTLNPLDPVVLAATPTVPGGNQTSMTFTTELFKGSYRAVITATPVTATDIIAPFEASFSAAGGGVLTETQTIALASTGNVVSLKFMEGVAAVPDAQIGSVSVFDAGSLVFLNQGISTNGVATVSTGAVANVIAIVSGPGGETLSAAAYTASPTHSATLTRYTVSGHVKAPGTTQLATPFGSVAATVKPGLGAFWDAHISGSAVNAAISDAAGTYSLKLFGGSWSLQAVQLTNLVNSAAVSANVTASVTTQDINVDAGGVIAGNIQDQTKINIPGVRVNVVTQDSNHTTVGSATTDAGGNYSIAVPFGTYEVFADGALTQGVAVSSSAATKTLNLTRFAISGRLTDLSLAAVVGRVTWAGGTATATTLGTFTINVMQGLNWFLFQPPNTSPSLGFAYELNALVNADTMKSLQ
jgi:hypothetical protein